jgi:acyl-CoA dehydrogenase
METIPYFDEAHVRLAAVMDEFVPQAVEPLSERDEEPGYDVAREYVRSLADARLLEHIEPQDIRSVCLIRERLAFASALADTMYAMQGLGSLPISLHGADDQREIWLPKIRAGTIAAFALTEPDAGSDPAGMKLSAESSDDGWVLNGKKTFISNAGIAGLYVLFARTGEGDKDAHSAFLVPGDVEGFTVQPMELIAPHPIGTLIFDHCQLPADALIGEVGQGLQIAFGTLDRFRCTVGAAACGMARRALQEAVRYAEKRVQFGKPLNRFQGVQFMLAEMATELDAARLLVARAAAEIDKNGPLAKRYSSMAKLFATDHAHAIIDRAVQIHGGLGVVKGSTVERLYREIRALRIYEGASEIQKIVIARTL